MIRKVLFGLGHPAHVHLFRNTIARLKAKGIEIVIVVSEKDILKDLMQNLSCEFFIIAKRDKKKSLLTKLNKQFNSTILLNNIITKEKPDLLVGCLSQLAFSGFLKRKPVLFFGEDDFKVTYLQGLSVYPFVKKIIAPEVTNVGPFRGKKISYNGYQKLAYLHPHYFIPDRSKVDIPESDKYFILRLSELGAYHDLNATGITDELACEIVNILESKGKIIISSERKLPDCLAKYLFKGNIFDIHHYLAFAELLISDSQSMSVEAAILGTPNIRFNNFIGKISVLNDLQDNYGLTLGIVSSDHVGLLRSINQLIDDNELKIRQIKRREKMISSKIDVTNFFISLIETYPESIKQGNITKL